MRKKNIFVIISFMPKKEVLKQHYLSSSTKFYINERILMCGDGDIKN